MKQLLHPSNFELLPVFSFFFDATPLHIMADIKFVKSWKAAKDLGQRAQRLSAERSANQAKGKTSARAVNFWCSF